MNANECAEKAVIVTGAAQGIGRTIAEQFLQQGANVLIFDLDAELAAETALQLAPSGEMVVSVGGDVSRREDVHRAVQTCIERFGRLDVMVAHAGIADATPLLEIDDEFGFLARDSCRTIAVHIQAEGARHLPQVKCENDCAIGLAPPLAHGRSKINLVKPS